MSFPTSPTNNQIAIVNGIRYSYSSATRSWTRISSGKYTASASAPTNPANGDHWYDTNNDILFEYIDDGTSQYWVDIQSLGQTGNISSIASSTLQGNIVVGIDNVYSLGAANGYVRNIFANAITANAITVNGNIVPGANVTYNLGSTTNRFKDLWLSGNTIYLGGATMSTDGVNVTISNPQGGSLNITGTSSGGPYGNTQVAAYLASGNTVVGTGAITLPSGTTDQRPSSPMVGMVRYNTTLNVPEWYDPTANSWKGFFQSSNYTIEYLVIAGGGGGGGATRGGGGGAGGYRSSVAGESSGGGASAEIPLTLSGGLTYAIIVGGGGASGAYNNDNGAAGGVSGTNSSFDSIISAGGGGGGASDTSGTDRSPKSGGSGGGGWYQHGSGGAGTTNQGYAGGTSATSPPYGAGGGGAGGVGGNWNSPSGPIGGIGVSSNINLTPTFRAGGGSSSNFQVDSGFAGGTGGGGVGRNAVGTTVGLAPSNGTNNTGGGGGSSGNGGSGIVIIRYAGAQRGTGGVVTTAGGYTIHTFTSSGSYIA
jgi:hypothetical protein